jgi:hypothetical protein
MENSLNLKPGQVMLVSAKAVKGGKIQLEFAQNLQTRVNVVSLLNESDERFTQSGPRRAWLSAQPADIKKHMNIDVTSLKEGETQELNLLNPKLAGQPLNLQIVETTEGSQYDIENFSTRAKRAGKEGPFILTKEGSYIYQNVSVVAGEPNHIFFKETVRSEEGAVATSFSAIDEALAEE